MKNTLQKNTIRSISRSFSRFVSIILIVAIGIAFFAGIKAASPDMRKTAEKYFSDNNLMDLRIQSNIGLSGSDVQAISTVEGVDYVMPVKFIDALVWVNGEIETDIDGSQISTRAYSVNLDLLEAYADGANDGAFINRPELLSGSYPDEPGECLVDSSDLSTPDSYQIGNTITLKGDGTSINATLNTTEFEIVGIIRSPYYLSFERGNSLVGSGKIGTYIYIPEDAFDTDYYSEVYVTVENADDYTPFSKAYDEFVSVTAEKINAISADRITVRATQLNLNLPSQISSAQTELNTQKAEIDKQFSEARKDVEKLQQLFDNGDEILAKAQMEYDAKFSAAQQELLLNQTDYAQKAEAYNEKRTLVANAEIKYKEEYAVYQQKSGEYNAKNTELQAASIKLESARNALNTSTAMINTLETVMTSLSALQSEALTQENIQSIASLLNSVNPDLYNSIISLTAQGTAADAMALISPYLTTEKASLSQKQAELDTQQAAFNAKDAELKAARQLLTESEVLLAQSNTALTTAKTELQIAYEQLTDYASQISSGQNQISIEQITAQQELYYLQDQVTNAESNLLAAKKKLAEEESEINDKILLAETKINNGQQLLQKLKDAKWALLTRADSPGFSSYQDALSNVSMLSNVFPVFFIIIAILVCATTLSRMVTDERVQIGTLKAIGYSNKEISNKYTVYALLASLIGSVIGVAGGLYLFPYAINSAYGIMFDMPKLIITYPWYTIVGGIVIAVAISVFVANISCRKALEEKPSSLMRPKAPVKGKRVFLEKLPFIWKKLSFTSKVTVRNTFRNAQRAIMTLLGIAGCTALLLAGFGMYDSINAIMAKQFKSDGISQYDFQLVFSEDQNAQDSEVMKGLERDNRIQEAMLTCMNSYVGYSDKSAKELDVYVLVPQDSENLSDYIRLQNRQTKEEMKLTDDGVLITEQLARDTNTDVGEMIFIRIDDDTFVNAKVSGIVENYTFNYIYMTPQTYQAIFGKAPGYSYAMGKLTEKVKTDAEKAEDGTGTEKSQLATDLMKYPEINAVAYTTDTMNSFTEIIKALSIIVIVFIGSAAILAFVVLYSLANNNLNERVRELATVKVLGFRDKEASAYLYRENIILTSIGIVIGLFMGIGLHKLIISAIEIDTVMFGRDIEPLSYIYAVAATVLFSVFVNLIISRKIKKVSMVESMKSVE